MGLFGNKKNNEKDEKTIWNIIEAKNPNIQKWEYLFLIVRQKTRIGSIVEDNNKKVYYINGNELKYKASINGIEINYYQDLIHLFGNQGWELVIYYPLLPSSVYERTFVFKRPKS